MLKRVYSKYKDEQEVFKLDKEYTLKEMLSLFAIPKAKIGWKGQKRKFKVIARNDNFIIIARPYNPKKTFEYSILDLEYMVCNHDNYYCKYDYANEKECIEALRELQETRDEEKKTILLAGAEKVKQLEKENKKLKEDRNNNNKMVALARNEVLNYMTGYEDGKKHKMTATAQVVENQQYYIIQKQMEKYEEHIKRLQKENEKLKNEVMEKDLEIIGKEEYTKASMKEIIEQYYTANEECILIQKVKDKIEKLNDESHAEELEDIMIGNNYTITELVQYVLQELLEGRK